MTPGLRGCYGGRACRDLLVTALAILSLSACGSESEGDDPPPKSPTGPSSPEPSARIAGLPDGWGGGSAAANAYELGRDFSVVHGGNASAYPRSRVAVPPPNSFVTLTQSIRAEAYRGKRVRLSGFLRAENVAGVGIGLVVGTRGSSRHDAVGA